MLVVKSKLSKFNDKFLATFSATIKEYAKISYISFTDEICKFDFYSVRAVVLRRIYEV